jgi:small subunit ribosomal protein S20
MSSLDTSQSKMVKKPGLKTQREVLSLATHKSALKRIRQNVRNYQRNVRIKSLVKSRVKNLRDAIQAKDTEQAKGALSAAIREIKRARSKGVLHKNTASRKVSKLTREFNTMQVS